MRKTTGILVLVLSMLLTAACGQSASSKPDESGYTVRIGHMGFATLGVAKEKGWLDEEFAKIGAKVELMTFTSGPPINEGIASKRIDLAVLGEGAVLSALHNQLDIKLLSLMSKGQKGLNHIIVPKGSDIKSVADLKGKQIGVMLGTSLHVFLVKTLTKEGLSQSDVKLVNLAVTDAQPAFQTGQLDAWVAPDPMATMELANGATLIASGESERIASPTFYIARGAFAKEHPEAVEAYLRVIDRTNRFQQEHTEEFLDIATRISGQDRALAELTLAKGEYENSPITEDILSELQASADILRALGYLEKPVNVSTAVDSSFLNRISE